MEALVDADVAVYRIGFKTEDIDEEEIVASRVDDLMNGILGAVSSTQHRCYLTAGQNNFRLAINPQYKANRLGKPKPRHYEFLREYFIEAWGAEMRTEDEADDAMGIRQTELGDDSIICTNDKDMYQVPGHHYNWTTGSFLYVDEHEAQRFFYQQILTGDQVDNVIGLFRVGPVKANKILGSVNTTDEGYWSAVVNAYAEHGRTIEEAIMNAKCVWIRRFENQIWNPPPI